MSPRAQSAALFEQSDSGAHDDAANARAGDVRNGQSQCPHCGDWFDNRGIGAHESTCNGDSDESEKSGESETEALPDTVERRLGIASVATEKLADRGAMTEAVEQWEASPDTDLFDGVRYSPKPSDSRTTAAAKAVIKLRHGYEPDAFRSVFGPCAADDCDNGANGYGAAFCAACTDTSDASGESDATADADAEAASESVTVTVNGESATIASDNPEIVAAVVSELSGE